MTPPVYPNSPPSPFPLIELKDHHQQQQQMQLLTSGSTPQRQTSSSLSFPIFLNISQDQKSSHDHFIEPKKGHEYILDVGSSDHRIPPPAYSIHRTVESSTKGSNGTSSCKLIEDGFEDKRDYESSKWVMPKKIRIVQKMMNAAGSTHDHKQERIIKIKFPDLEKDKCEIISPSHSSTGNVVRICSDCKTTKTPLWRSGPQGPKSLCNACGIRQRKARRAMLAAAANGTVLTMENSTKTTQVRKKEKKSRSSYHMAPYNKPFGGINTPQRNWERISFEDFALSMSKSLGFRRAFPKDEEEAAILLMALSCGLLHN